MTTVQVTSRQTSRAQPGKFERQPGPLGYPADHTNSTHDAHLYIYNQSEGSLLPNSAQETPPASDKGIS